MIKIENFVDCFSNYQLTIVITRTPSPTIPARTRGQKLKDDFFFSSEKGFMQSVGKRKSNGQNVFDFLIMTQPIKVQKSLPCGIFSVVSGTSGVVVLSNGEDDPFTLVVVIVEVVAFTSNTVAFSSSDATVVVDVVLSIIAVRFLVVDSVVVVKSHASVVFSLKVQLLADVKADVMVALYAIVVLSDVAKSTAVAIVVVAVVE